MPCPYIYCLFNMGMVADVILAVAEIAVATGTVAELQFRIADVGFAAYGAAVGIGNAGFLWGLFGEGDGSGLLRRFLFLVLQPGSPGRRKNVDHIGAVKQEIVCQCHKGEKVMGEHHQRYAHIDHLEQRDTQIDESQNPGPDGDEKEKNKAAVRIAGGKAQQHRQMEEAGHIAGVETGKIVKNLFLRIQNLNAAASHSKNIHQDNTCEIVEVKAQSSPAGFHSPAQGIIAV